MQPQLRKACPRCQTQTGLTASQCLYCGHQYRTLFVPPSPVSEAVQPTRKLTVLAPEIKDMAARQAALALVAVITLSGLLLLASPSLSGREAGFSRADKIRKSKIAPVAPPVTRISSPSRIAEAQP